MKPIVFGHKAPEYLPSLAYCALADCVDRFYVDASFQYSRQSFQNRARLRTPDGIQWITIPVRGGQFGRSIEKTEIDYRDNWVRKHEKAFRFNYGSTPFYEHYTPPLMEVLGARPASLGALTVAMLKLLHSVLEWSSELIEGSPVASGEHVLTAPAVEEVDVVAAIGPSDGRSINPFQSVRSIAYIHPRYRQNFPGFHPGLSVLDLLFNHGPEAGDILRSGLPEAGRQQVHTT